MSLNTILLLPRKFLVGTALAAASAGRTRKAVAVIPSAPATPIRVRRVMSGAAGWRPGSLLSISTPGTPVRQDSQRHGCLQPVPNQRLPDTAGDPRAPQAAPPRARARRRSRLYAGDERPGAAHLSESAGHVKDIP